MSALALVREVSPSIVRCELTHLAREPIDYQRARAQHAAYVHALESLDCRIEMLPPAPELPDAVFVEDTAVVLDEVAVITRPGAESRRAETDSVANVLVRYRPLHAIVAPARLDGGDVLRVEQNLFVGLSPRTNIAGIEQLARFVELYGYQVHAAPVSGCLHLKSAVTAVADGTLLINPGWVSPRSFAGLKFIEVDPSEPFAANALLIDGQVIHASEFSRTRGRLRAAGIPVHPVEASELAKAEGGVTCCSLILADSKAGRTRRR
jgi:dimethylargininase